MLGRGIKKRDRKKSEYRKSHKQIGVIGPENTWVDRQDRKENDRKYPFKDFIHYSLSPNNPVGLIASTTAITRNIRTGASWEKN